jgi:hypothetical protein
MNKILLEATEFTPHVSFDHIDFVFEIKGESSPEDARAFYAPLIKWVDDFAKYLHFLYASSPLSPRKPIHFVIHMDYVTSSSLKNIYTLLLQIDLLKAYTSDLKVKWIYDKGDEDMQDNGIEFSKMVKTPFEILSA